MATVKLAIWLARNDEPAPIKAQKAATSRIGPAAVAVKRLKISFFSGSGAHLTEFLSLFMTAGG